MMEAKHHALMDEAQRRGHASTAQLRLCFQLLSLSSSIDRDCATRLAPHGLSEGRFIVLFLLHGAGGTLPLPQTSCSFTSKARACSRAGSGPTSDRTASAKRRLTER